MREKPVDSTNYLGFLISSSNAGSSKSSDYSILAMNSSGYATLSYNQTTYYLWKFYASSVSISSETTTVTDVSLTESKGRNYLGIYISKTVPSTDPTYLSVSKWILFRDIKSSISTHYTSDGMKFMNNDTEVIGSVSSDGFYLANGIISDGGTFRMGNYLWTPLSDGSLSLIFSPLTSTTTSTT